MIIDTPMMIDPMMIPRAVFWSCSISRTTEKGANLTISQNQIDQHDESERGKHEGRQQMLPHLLQELHEALPIGRQFRSSLPKYC